MAEVKNTFIKSKMNKDLDDRLIPNGEYRDAVNIQVSKSESSDVGALENVLGNFPISNIQANAGFYDLECIGYLVDDTRNTVYLFMTNYTDDAAFGSTPVFSPLAGNHHHSIYSYNAETNTLTKIVHGNWLNFSANKPIIGVNILEDLLFWTDDRNQPRKINVNTALNNPDYYSREEHVSVAKYHPYQPISFLKQEIEKITSIVQAGLVFLTAKNNNIKEGMVVLGIDLSNEDTITANEYVTIKEIDQSYSSFTEITLSDSSSLTVGDTLYFLSCTMTDESENANWPGDPKYLENKFVRFGYRFKFDDNEYSIFSPFTQIAFIPKQKGHFLAGQEDNAISSTIVEWFENSVNNVELIIPLPDKAYKVPSSYKITDIEILYTESDQTSIKVIDTIHLKGLGQEGYEDNFYSYSYQSRKPIRTLPQAETTRVYDKVPVKAKAQEIVSNRLVYGNFLTKHTPPTEINYTVSVQDKITSPGRTNFIEFPNHTVKQNRNYQIGFVLADKFGRHSDVILSSVKNSGSDGFGGSTVYAGYISDDPEGSYDPDSGLLPNGPSGWFGNSILLNVKSAITGGVGVNAPGLYATDKGVGFDVKQNTSAVITDTTYTFEIATDGNSEVPETGDYLRGEFVDYVKVTNKTGAGTQADPYEITTDGRINNTYSSNPLNDPDTKFAYSINKLGWYSYKIVVKQVEQEYYNVYLPSAVSGNGFLTSSTDTDTAISYITLINDNINKVPRDLSEVGPDQKQYRSSVKLYGRVQPTYDSHDHAHGNRQFYPLSFSDVSTAVGNRENIASSATTTNVIYQYDSNPILARISTHKQFGVPVVAFNHNTGDRFQLSVYETEPFVSNIDIYWESTQSGLISDLNWEVAVGFSGPKSLEAIEPTLTEDDAIGAVITDSFFPLDRDGNAMPSTNISSFTVVSLAGVDATSDFTINQNSNGSYYVTTANTFAYEYFSIISNNYTFSITVADNNIEDSDWGQVEFTFSIPLGNIAPSFDEQGPDRDDYYTFNEIATTDTVIHNFGTSNNPRNGSVKTASNQEGLRWSISGADANLFTIDAETGELKPSEQGIIEELNTYTIDVTLKDAVSNSGGLIDTNSLSVTQTYKVIKQFTPMNISPDSVNINTLFKPSNQNNDFCNKDYWCFYFSNNTIVTNELPSFSGNSTYTYHYGEDNVCGGNPNTPIKMGVPLGQGAFVFGLQEAKFTMDDANYDAEANHTGQAYVNAYYRLNNTSSWVRIDDLNNYDGSFGIGNLYQNADNENIAERYAFFSQNTTGEYAFVVKVITDPISGGANDEVEFTAKASIIDLHYNGANQSQNVYQYLIYEGGGSNFSSGATASGTSRPIYSDNPLVEYNTVFYTGENGTTDFTEVYTPPSGQYYIIQLVNGPYGTVQVTTRDRAGRYNLVYANTIDETGGIVELNSSGRVVSQGSGNPVVSRYKITGGGGSVSSTFNDRATLDGTNVYFG